MVRFILYSNKTLTVADGRRIKTCLWTLKCHHLFSNFSPLGIFSQIQNRNGFVDRERIGFFLQACLKVNLLIKFVNLSLFSFRYDRWPRFE